MGHAMAVTGNDTNTSDCWCARSDVGLIFFHSSLLALLWQEVGEGAGPVVDGCLSQQHHSGSQIPRTTEASKHKELQVICTA
jgi:hypothetical protein